MPLRPRHFLHMSRASLASAFLFARAFWGGGIAEGGGRFQGGGAARWLPMDADGSWRPAAPELRCSMVTRLTSTFTTDSCGHIY